MGSLTLIYRINEIIINPIISFLFVVALLVFFWGVFQFIRDVDGKNSQEGKNHMLWGLVGLFIMVSVFGIMKFILNTFDVSPDPSVTKVLPKIR